MISFQVEAFRDGFDEDVKPLIDRHYHEIALFQDRIKLKPRWERYYAMADAGLLHVVTARDEGKLVGYYINIVMPHLHYEESLTAHLDIYFLSPELRQGRTGIKMFQFMEQVMKDLGVEVIYTGTKISNDITAIWQRLGYKYVENKLAKFIG